MKDDGARFPGSHGARGPLTRAACTGVTPEPFVPDVYSYGYYISTLVRRNGLPSGSLDSLEAALAEMAARNLKPGPNAFTPFAWLAFNFRDWEMGKVRRPSCGACAAAG